MTHEIESRQPTIVVADDDVDVRAMIVDILRGDGHRVEWEGCGAGLLYRLSQRRDTTLVVTDLRMPWVDGLEVLERVARMGLHVPAILCTAYAHDGEVRERARALDVPVLGKPVELSALRAEVEGLLDEQDFWTSPEHDGYSEIRPRVRPLAM